MMGQKVTMFFNPDCSKCKEARELLEAGGCEIEFVEYLKDAPSKNEIESVLKLLGLKASELVRMKEEKAIELSAEKELSEEQWLDAMHNYPELIERPIVIYGNKAMIGRPASRVLNIIGT